MKTLSIICPGVAHLEASVMWCRGTLARSWSWHNSGKLTHWLPGFLDRIGLKQNAAVELPMWQTGSAAKGVDDLETGEERLVLGGRNKQDVEGAPATPSLHHRPLLPTSLA